MQVGDWSARVWADDVLGSSLITINTGTEILTGNTADTQWAECDVIPTDGCWSRSRPSVIFLSRSDGWLEAWDIILEQAGH